MVEASHTTSSSLGSKVRSVYAWALFTLIVLPLVPVAGGLAWLDSRRGASRDGLRRVIARWISVYARLSPLYDFQVVGRERLPRLGGHVIVANHESGLDVLCLFLLGSPARFLSAEWVRSIPIVGLLFDWCEHIAMDPTTRVSREAATKTVTEAIEGGTPVAFFPEGRIPGPGEGLADFRLGAFRVALATGVPVLPVVLRGTGKAWAKGTWVVEGHHRVDVEVLPAVQPEPGETPELLAARVREQMAAALGALAGLGDEGGD